MMSSFEVTRQTLLILLPELLILLTATVMMTAGAFVRGPRWVWCASAVGALVAALVVLFSVGDRPVDLYSAVALNDAFSRAGRLFLLLTGLVLLALAHDQVDDARAPEFFGAILMIQAGSMLVASANELVFLFVGLELVSIPTYLLLYLSRRNANTQEAATKYFFLSIFSSALLKKYLDRKSTRLNSSHPSISYAVFCLKKKKKQTTSALYICYCVTLY